MVELKVGIGIIGTGFMGSLHAKVFFDLPEAKLVAVQDVDEKKAKLTAEKYDIDYYTDYGDLLKRSDVDAVLIATPDHLHREPAIAAAEAGKHILLEKPIASSIEDAKAIIEAAEEAKVKLMIAHVLRFDPRYHAIKSAIEEGNIGKPILLYARRNDTITEARRLRGRVPVALFLAIHDVDLMLWYVDSKVTSVFAENANGRVREELGVPDFTWILFKFKTGALGSVESGWGLPENWIKWKTPKSWGGACDYRMEVIGTEGSIYLNFFPTYLYACDKEGWKFPEFINWPTLYNEIVGDLMIEDHHFLRCVVKDEEPLVKGEDGLSALEVVLAAVKSYETGKKVNLATEV